MSKKRICFIFGYLSFILLLLAPIILPWPSFNESPTEAWNRYHAWLGPAPDGLELVKTQDAEGLSIHYTFTFPPAPETENHITTHYQLHSAASTIPGEPMQEAAAPVYRPQHKRICWLAGNNDWGYVIDDLALTRRENGRSQLSFRYMADVPDTSATVGAYYPPDFEQKMDRLNFIISLLAIPYFLCWSLFAPLGFLLLFPRFTLRCTLHTVIWYAAVITPQLLLFIAAHLFIHDPAIIGAWIVLFFGTPPMILGARLLLPLGKRIAQS